MISNEEVLTMVNEKRCLIRTICQREKNWIEHVIGGEGMLKDVLQKRMLGKKHPGGPSIGTIDDL